MKEGNHYYMNLENEMSFEPQSVLEAITPLYYDFGFGSIKNFESSLEKSLKKYNKPHVLVLLGEPNSGKSHILREIVGNLKITTPGDLIQWGDLFSLAKLKGKIPLEKKFGEMSNEDLNAATDVLGELLREEIVENKGEKRLIAIEIPAVTGAYIYTKSSRKEDFVGKNRGIRTTLWDLARRKKEFKDLDYESYWLGIISHPEISGKGMELRSRLAQERDPEKMKRLMEKEGDISDSGSLDEILRYVQESPNEKAVRVIAEEANFIAKRMSEAGKFPLNLEELNNDKEYRSRIIGEVLKVILKTNIRVKSNRVFVGYNREKLEKRRFRTSVPINNLIWLKYPQVEKIANK